MEKQQIKLLKKIKKADVYDYSILSAEERKIIYFLRDNKYIISKPPAETSGRPRYSITELGKIALNENKKEFFKIFYPNLASTMAIFISTLNLILSILGII